MRATLKYAWLTIKHKYFVLIAGVSVGAPLLQLVFHDLSKLGHKELKHYGRQFFGAADDPDGFISCWIHHQNHNPHHWEYWIPRTGHNRCTPPYPDNQPIPMSENYALEMLADWFGASRAYEGKWPKPGDWPWLQKNFEKIVVHPNTRKFLVKKLVEMGYEEINNSGTQNDKG